MRYHFFIAALMLAAAAGAQTPAGTTTQLALLETTDLHANALGYDYYKLAPEPSHGLDRLATVIAQARADYPNNLLLDSGDTIQGTALADYQALANPVPCSQALAIYKVMNYLGYDGGGIGNHEFNYGLGFLNQVTGSRFDVAGVAPQAQGCSGPAFPLVLANVYSLKTHQPLFKPWTIIEKQVAARDADGQPVTATLKVGIIGFAPPTILSWDQRYLEGKVYVVGVREAALRFIPELRAAGADLIVALSHGGIDGAGYTPTMENASYHLASVPGVDAMLIGHSHQVFPNAASTLPQFNLPGVDKARGLVNGIPTVMANMWGKHLGVIALNLRHDGKRWTVDKEQTRVEVRATQLPDRSFVAPDPVVAGLIAAEHAATIDYVKTPIGATRFRMSTYFADAGDASAIAIVNQAQTEYVKRALKTDLPVLSMAAPFKGGAAGPKDYTDVAPGPLALNHAADLYLYPNALAAVKIDGAQLKAWLEHAAERFNRIDPARQEPQELVNPAFAQYNFDALTSPDVRYEIDVSQPVGQRIVKLSYRGTPITAAQQFVIATNSYRAGGGGHFPGIDGSKTILSASDQTRNVLAAYIKATGTLVREAHGGPPSWRFARLATRGPVLLHAPPGLIELARQANLPITQLSADDGRGKGTAAYAVDLAK
ncbi:MAG: bifunctional 2',3'-cyclic-nucleotide 2'-phosphodiesterase/3'-nucleotidase [Gammaproteobacteria bacterium]